MWLSIGDFEIVCPYCNAEFISDISDDPSEELRCPECGNLIEVDWHECEDGCDHNCGGDCSCDHCEDEEVDDYEEEDEDDM
ncbi:MAG: hypothetical protein HFJ51_06980 [Clostridia bacterium]|nr:hypothetical protein [Clostridia bacterium]